MNSSSIEIPKKCVCGEDETLACDYFKFDGTEPLVHGKLWGCEECHKKNKVWCFTHDVQLSVTNDPLLKGLNARFRISPELIGFCVSCIEDDIRNTTSKRYEECILFLERRCDRNKLQILSDRANRLLPFNMNWRESLILGCYISNHIEPSSIEQIALHFAFDEKPRQFYKRAVEDTQYV